VTASPKRGGARRWAPLLHRLDTFEDVFGVALLVALGILLAVQVFLRFSVGLGYSWMEEIIRMLFVWVIFVGAVSAMRRHLHIRVEAGFLLFPRPLRPFIGLLGDLVLFAFCLAVTWHGLQLVLSSADGTFRLQSTRVSMFWPYLIVPISFGLQAVRLALWRFGVRPVDTPPPNEAARAGRK
jgi:TRAP-type C4-dicarboxylate transport system permease small subunit